MKTVAGEYKRRRKAGTVAEQFRERRGKAHVAPAPVPGPAAPKDKDKAPAPKADTGALEAMVKEVLQAQALLAQSMAEVVAAKQSPPTFTVRITSRDGNRNIRSLVVTPEKPPAPTRH